MPGFLGGSGAATGGTGGEISFPKEFVDPVTKLRISNPENLIDTDFEYGLQPTKWETVELINNTPSFFSKSGDTTIPGIVSIITNAGTREITVTTALDHGLAVGIPINVQGTKSVTADGSYIINSIPDTTTFTYLSRDIQPQTSAIEDLYTSIITGEFFQGSQLRVADSDGIVTDAASVSTLTVTTENPHGFGPNTPFYFLNLNSTISQEFEAANTAAKSFDASNSATAQSFDGSNSLSQLNIDWSNSATVGGTISTVSGVNTVDNTITVTHSSENFSGLSVGQPLYYNVNSSLGYFNQNPRGVVFLKTNTDLDVGSSTFQVSEIPDGDAINLQANMTGSFQIANQARTFAGNNVNAETQTVIDIVRENPFTFEGANDQSIGGNGICTVTSYSSPFVNVETSAGAGLDLYVGAMVRYDTTGSAASGLTDGATYFIANYQDNGGDAYTLALKELPTDENLISVSGGTGTQTFTRIGVSLDKDIVHVKDSFFSEKDMIEYSYPSLGNFEADEEKNFYFVSVAYDQHNYQLNAVSESFIAATGGTVTQTIQDASGRNYTVHRFTSDGTFTLNVSDAGTFSQDLKFTIEGSGSSFGGATTQGTRAAAVESITVVVANGGRVDVAYPQDDGTNDIAFSTINPIAPSATGGSTSDVTINGVEYRIHAFTSTGTSTFTVNSLGNFFDGNLDYLIVAGGGGGGHMDSGAGAAGGGGGAGGLLSGTTTVAAQSYSIVVGSGGGDQINSTQNIYAQNGGNSSAFGNTAIGGGGGGTRDFDGRDGGSGGGTNNGITGWGDGVSGQGNRGGGGENSGSPSAGGGGGGAGEVGENGKNQGFSTNVAGKGGDGLYFGNIFTDSFGDSGWFAGGGGGGNGQPPADGVGGLGGGGNGGGATSGSSTRSRDGFDAQANTGGGGGGAAGSPARGGNGGSGIVLVRYPLEPASGGN